MRGSIMTRILIADDHPLVRKGLKDILSGAMGKIEFGEAEDAQQTIAESRKSTWDLIVLDLSMPAKRSRYPQANQEINRNRLFLGLDALGKQFALRAIRAGASSYLSKDTDIESCSSYKCSLGAAIISRTLAKGYRPSGQQYPEAPHETERPEFQILACSLREKDQGYIEGHVAEHNDISNCRQHILEK